MKQDAMGKALAPLRKEIDRIDDDILVLLEERAGVVKKVGDVKKRHKSGFYVPSREDEIVRRLERKAKGSFPKTAVRTVFREIISACLALEKPLRVAYFGPSATYTHEAAMRSFGQGAEYLPFRSITEVFDEVARSRADFGVVPVENSTEGVVTHTLDMFVRYDLVISAETSLPINHCLAGRLSRKEEIKVIYSHPQPFAQCRGWLEKHLPSCRLVEVSSTAEAAEMARNEPGAAAIAGEAAARLYNLHIIEKNIQDISGNATRFIVIGQFQPKPTGNDKTSVVFAIKDEPGALYSMLMPFARRSINMTKIESRPMKTRAWEYVFFIDLDGHRDDPRITEAVAELSTHCMMLKIIGSYPKSKKEAR